MLINLSDVSSNENKTITLQADIEMNAFSSRLGEFSIVDKKPVRLTISNAGYRKVVIEAATHLMIAIPCDRCTEPVNTEFSLEISKEIDFNLSEADRINDLDESDYMEGYELDVDKLIYGEILLNWPMKTLCKDDCKGICNQCGQNLNKGTCKCDNTVYDPRMAAIRDIFNNYKQ